MICKYFLHFINCLFYFLDDILLYTKFFILMKPNLSYFVGVDCAFAGIYKNLSPIPRYQRLTPMFSTKSFIVLYTLTFRCLPILS